MGLLSEGEEASLRMPLRYLSVYTDVHSQILQFWPIRDESNRLFRCFAACT